MRSFLSKCFRDAVMARSNSCFAVLSCFADRCECFLDDLVFVVKRLKLAYLFEAMLQRFNEQFIFSA